MEEKIKVYVKIDKNKNVTYINSGIFIKDLTDWIEIDEGYGDKFSHAQSHYFELPLVDENGKYNYQYIDGGVKCLKNL